MSDSDCVCGEINARNCPVHQGEGRVCEHGIAHYWCAVCTPSYLPLPQSKGPREYWIEASGDGQLPMLVFESPAELTNTGVPIHVIEASAYDKLKAERDENMRVLSSANADLTKERDELYRKLEELEESKRSAWQETAIARREWDALLKGNESLVKFNDQLQRELAEAKARGDHMRELVDRAHESEDMLISERDKFKTERDETLADYAEVLVQSGKLVAALVRIADGHFVDHSDAEMIARMALKGAAE